MTESSGRTSGRSPGGHRLYRAADVARLHQIRSLRQLGLSIGEIRDSLARPTFTLRRVLEENILVRAGQSLVSKGRNRRLLPSPSAELLGYG